MTAGAVVLALGLTSPVIANAVCIDEPCPPAKPAAGAGWKMANFPAPNGGVVAYRIMGSNPACASYDGRNCLWGMKVSQIDFNRVHPLVCGASHRAQWASPATRTVSIGAIWQGAWLSSTSRLPPARACSSFAAVARSNVARMISMSAVARERSESEI
jgi:hypothetical protein